MEQVFIYIIIILSAVFHEFAHGWMAYRLGDTTAKDAGRLTLNPFVHIDMFGTVLLPLLSLFTAGTFIGWAKPVPYNPYNLSDRRYGSLKVGAAGPAANLIIAILLGLLIRFSRTAPILSPEFLLLVQYIVYINIFIALFNLLPFPPLDGSKVFADLFPRQWGAVMRLGMFGIFIAILLSFYILSPIAQLVFRLITGGHGIF